MTPKEKAEELRSKYHNTDLKNPLYGVLNYEESVGAAIIAVDVIISMLIDERISTFNRSNFWDKVRKELVKMLDY